MDDIIEHKENYVENSIKPDFLSGILITIKDY
jgi:hypothetical protein